MLAILHALGMVVADLFRSRRWPEAEIAFLRRHLNLASRQAPRWLPLHGRDRAKHIAAVLIAACLVSSGEAATPLAPPNAAQKIAIEPRGRAYLFRGMIDLIDWGMDKLAQRINGTGVTASINSYVMWYAVANQAISDYRRDPAPIAIIGHSMGGDAAVQFAKYLDAAQIPVGLLVTYDPTRYADRLPSNVERYVNLYKSSGFLGGGDIVQGPGFHGHYASFNLKDRPEIVHTNMDKFYRIQEQLVDKIRSLAATSAKAQGEAVPLRIAIPPAASIELWDSGLPVLVHDGDTLQTLAATYRVPLWALAEVNRTCSISWIGLPICSAEPVTLTEGQRIIVPRYLVPMVAPSPVWSYPPTGR